MLEGRAARARRLRHNCRGGGGGTDVRMYSWAMGIGCTPPRAAHRNYESSRRDRIISAAAHSSFITVTQPRDVKPQRPPQPMVPSGLDGSRGRAPITKRDAAGSMQIDMSTRALLIKLKATAFFSVPRHITHKSGINYIMQAWRSPLRHCKITQTH